MTSDKSNTEKLEAESTKKSAEKPEVEKGVINIKGRVNGKFSWQVSKDDKSVDVAFLSSASGSKPITGVAKLGAGSLALSIENKQEPKEFEGENVNIMVAVRKDQSANGVLTVSFPFDNDTECKWSVTRWVITAESKEEKKVS